MLFDMLFNREIRKILRTSPKKSKKNKIVQSEYNSPSFYKIGDYNFQNLIDLHEIWVKTDGEQGEQLKISDLDLHGCDLSNVNLFRASLTNCDLSQSKLSGVNLWGANLTGSVFWKSDLSNSILIGAFAKDADMSNADLKNSCTWGADFHNANFRSVNISNCDMSYSNFDEIHEMGSAIYSKKTILSYVTGSNNTWSTNLPMKKQWESQNFLLTFKKNHAYLYFIWKLTCNCGESIIRWLLWNIVLLGIFSIIIIQNPTWIDLGDYNSALSPLYFSFVTFVTLGYGDFLPTCWQGQALAMCISALGYMSLGALITIFSKKIVI